MKLIISKKEVLKMLCLAEDESKARNDLCEIEVEENEK